MVPCVVCECSFQTWINKTCLQSYRFKYQQVDCRGAPRETTISITEALPLKHGGLTFFFPREIAQTLIDPGLWQKTTDCRKCECVVTGSLRNGPVMYIRKLQDFYRLKKVFWFLKQYWMLNCWKRSSSEIIGKSSSF